MFSVCFLSDNGIKCARGHQAILRMILLYILQKHLPCNNMHAAAKMILTYDPFQCISTIAFVKNEGEVLDSPIWIMLINIVALEMLGAKMPKPTGESRYFNSR